MEENKELITAPEETRAVAPVSEKTIKDYLAAFGLASTLTDTETQQFVEVAKAFALNPFKREIYCVPYVDKQSGKRKLSIITGYETYLKRAEHTGLLDGWECSVEGQGPNMKAVVTIYRKGWSRPFKHEVYFSEYNTNKSLWVTKPRTMLKKVAVAQAFRLCFPDDMGGMPYTNDELPEEMSNLKDVTPAAPAVPAEETKASGIQITMCEEEPPVQPQKRKATPEEIEKMAELAASFTKKELSYYKDKHNGDPAGLIEELTKAKAAKEAAISPEPVAEEPKHRWASPEQKEALEKLESEGQKTVGEPAPHIFPDDSEELYK